MLERLVRIWQDLLDSLNTDGGHIVMLVIAVGLGLYGVKIGISKADDIVIGAGSILASKLKETVGSSKTRRDRPLPTIPTEPPKEIS